MPRFEPFAGLRYDLTRAEIDLAAVTAPPYDIIDADERQALAGRSPYNIVHVDVPVPSGAGDPYGAAAAELARWRAEGVLVEDASPSFTLYRMSFTDEGGRARRTLGVIGALELVGAGEGAAGEGGGVLPHERTTPKATTDRLRLLQAAATNTSAIWGLSLAGTLSAALAPEGPPAVAWTDATGVTHEAWRVDEPARCAAISMKVAGAPVVVADGHHRYDTCRTYRDERRAAAGGAPGAYDLTLALVVELAPEQLDVQAIHRLLHGVASLDRLRAVLAESFTLHPIGPVDAATTGRMAADGALCLVTPDGEGTLLVPHPDVFDGVDELDSARLGHALAPLAPAPELTYQHGVAPVLAQLRAGQADAAVLLRPVTVGVIEAMAHARQLMPPKSTFFAPKPATGVVLRPL